MTRIFAYFLCISFACAAMLPAGASNKQFVTETSNQPATTSLSQGDTPVTSIEAKPTILDSIFGLGLPVLDIETVNHEEPTCEIVAHPEGCMGSGIKNATKVPGRLNIYCSNSTTPDYTSGEYKKDASGMTLRIRGNASAQWPKKPYKIKLQKKANLMLLGDDKTYRDKDWLLIKDHRLYTLIGCKVNELLGVQWTPRCRYVNVIINGDFRGLYLLMESVKRNTKGRLNVSESGFIFEHDAYWWNENEEYVSSIYTPEYNYTFKYPEWEDMTDERRSHITQVISQYEQSLSQATYLQYIDVESFAAWLLGHDLLGTLDSGGSNMYFTKYDDTDTSLIKMANMWDFDSSEMMQDEWANQHFQRQFKCFFESRYKDFSRCYVKKWNEIKSTFFTDILNFVDRFAESEEGLAFKKSVRCNNKRWDYSYQGLDYEVKHAHDWFSRREEWLSQAIAGIDTIDYNQEPTLSLGKTIRIQAENYSEGGQGTSYCSHNVTDGDYRDDIEGITLVTGTEYANNFAIGYMGNDWSTEGIGLTREQAIEQWGAWFNYAFTAAEDMEIAINLKAGVNWEPFSIISEYGSASQIIGEPDITNWVKRYSASAVVAIDGVELRPNQSSHPASNGLDEDAYLETLNDKSMWTVNPEGDNALWLYPNRENLKSWTPYYQKDVYGEPDNFTVDVKKGRHILTVKSLASQWFFDEMQLEGRETSAIANATAAADDFSVHTVGTKIYVNHPRPEAVIEVADVAGRRIFSGTGRMVNVGSSGIYIVRMGGVSRKVLVK